MSIFLVRHGDTRLSGTFCGSSNPPLTRRGREQGQAVAKQLAKLPIDLCYASPLLRASQTATLIARHLQIPMISHPFLKEIHFGLWEGLRFRDIEKKWPDLAKQWARDPMKVRIPKAESFISLRRRVHLFISFLKKGNLIVVAHGGTLAAMTLELLGLPNRDFPKHIPPTGSVRMIHNGRIKTLC